MRSRANFDIDYRRRATPVDHVVAFEGSESTSRADSLATEEPLEIRLVLGGRRLSATVTMRTPGDDFELVSGWLFSEGVVLSRSDIARMSYCVDRDLSEEQRFNIVNVELRGSAKFDAARLARTSFASSSCGVCGKASIEQLAIRGVSRLPSGRAVEPRILYDLAPKLREAQGTFEVTGGLHAAGLFDADANLLVVKEDVGRHNALDKLLGWGLLNDHLPFADRILLVSGRTSFELVQKALVARIPILCAVSAPSSLARDVARAFGMTLVGFLRGGRFNVYAGEERITPSPVLGA